MSDLLPPNATPQERALALATARLADVPVPLKTLHNPDTCPAALLPWLAWAESVDDWDAGWSEARKRAVIAASRAVHEKKGTAAALKQAVAALGLDLTLAEWFEQEPPGDPYTFRAEFLIDQIGMPNPADVLQLIATARAAKNLRSWMVASLNGLSSLGGHVAAAAHYGITVSILPEPA